MTGGPPRITSTVEYARFEALSSTTSCTGYRPPSEYAWVGLDSVEAFPSPNDQRSVYGGVPPLTLAEKARVRLAGSTTLALATAFTAEGGTSAAPYHAWYCASTRKSSTGKPGSVREAAIASRVIEPAYQPEDPETQDALKGTTRASPAGVAFRGGDR